jgi:trehalose 6-phosphate phosphatase
MDALPTFARTALMLDLDGTLVDFAPTPDAVVVAPGLPESLRRLRSRLGDALAVITGRPIETIDHLLGDVPYAVAGEHGGVVRHAPGAPAERPDLPAAPEKWVAMAQQLVARHPGTLLERKARGFTMHFRLAPEAGPAIFAALAEALTENAAFDLLPGNMMWEVRPRGADKGSAVTALMAQPPFTGRLPLFIGDDVTDEAAMERARAMGGAGLRVDAAFGDPAGVRAWLHGASSAGDWPPLPGAA